MKKITLLLSLVASVTLGAEPFVFRLVGPLKVEKATYFLDGDQTGGSVSVVLRDSKGKQSFVHFLSKDFGEEHGGGLLTFRAGVKGPKTTFARASEDEARLVRFLRAACVESFGSSDPGFLKDPDKWLGEKDGFERMAMGSLLRHFTTIADVAGAEPPSVLPESKPKDGEKPQPEPEGRSR